MNLYHSENCNFSLNHWVVSDFPKKNLNFPSSVPLSRQLSSENPGMLFSSTGKNKDLGSANDKRCASFLTQRVLTVLWNAWVVFLGVRGRSWESPSWRLKLQFVGSFCCFPHKMKVRSSCVNKVFWGVYSSQIAVLMYKEGTAGSWLWVPWRQVFTSWTIRGVQPRWLGVVVLGCLLEMSDVESARLWHTLMLRRLPTAPFCSERWHMLRTNCAVVTLIQHLGSGSSTVSWAMYTNGLYRWSQVVTKGLRV